MITKTLLSVMPLPRRPAGLRITLLASLLVTTPALPGSTEDVGPAVEPAIVHYAFAKSLFTDVNENDAQAAVKVYSKLIGDDNGIVAGDGPLLLDGTNDMADALRLNQVDLLCLATEDFFTLENRGLEGPLLLATVNQSFTEEYVLLAREDSSIRKVEDLKGRSLIILSDVRLRLGRTWFEVLCREHGLGPSEQACATVTPSTKVSLVVLPVFFGKADACVITRNGWDVMGELNPQVKKQLRVIEKSQPMVPVVTCFRSGFSETLKQRVIKAAEGSSRKPSFKQLMELFKSDGLVHQPVSALESARQLLAKYHQVCGGSNEAQTSRQTPALIATKTQP